LIYLRADKYWPMCPARDVTVNQITNSPQFRQQYLYLCPAVAALLLLHCFQQQNGEASNHPAWMRHAYSLFRSQSTLIFMEMPYCMNYDASGRKSTTSLKQTVP
jgi:hypothetical protein